MTTEQILDWMATEFAPLKLATAREAQRQIVDNAIRYWNVHSAFPHVEMVTLAGSSARLSNHLKSVARAWPATQSTTIFQDHPLFSLLGIVLLDNITNDLITLAEGYRTYKAYVGTDFQYSFIRSSDPALGPTLFVANMPIKSNTLAVLGTKQIIREPREGQSWHEADWEDIKDPVILDWLLRYAKALLKKAEGNVLRKSDLIGAKNDGQQIYSEGEDERKQLEEDLGVSGRWVMFGRRA